MTGVTEMVARMWRVIFPCGFVDDFKILVINSIPLILTSLSQIFSPIVSMIFCGQLGTTELAGVALANSIINMIIFVSAIGLATACDTLFPQIFGGEDKEKMGIILQKALLICILSFLGGSATLLYSCNLLVVLTSEPEVSRIATNYMVYFVPSILFVNFTAVFVRYVQSQNIVYPIMIINCVSIGLNALFHQIFVFWLNIGLDGASIAINISSFVNFVMILALIYFKKVYVGTWTGWSIECLYDWKIYLKFAIPGLFAIFIEWSNFEIGNLAAAALDEVQLAIISVASQTILVSYQFSYGIGTAANIRIGQFLGANKPQNAKNTAKVSYTIVAFEAVSIVCFLYFGAEIVVKIFEKDPEVIAKGVDLFSVSAFVHLLDSFQGNCNGIIRAVGGQLFSTIIYLCSFYFVGAPIGLCLMFLTPLKTKGFMIGALCGLTVVNILQTIFLTCLNWEKVAQKAHDQSMKEVKSAPALSNGKVHPIENELESKQGSRMDLFQIEDSNSELKIENSEMKDRKKSLKRTLITKSLVLLIFLAIFLSSIFLRDIVRVDSTKSTLSANQTTESFITTL